MRAFHHVRFDTCADADERNVGDTAFTFFFDFEGSRACDGPWTGLFGGSSSSKSKSKSFS